MIAGIALPDPASLWLFAAAAALLLVTPGPAVLFIVARSIDQGRRAGLVSTLGIGAGTLFHVAAASLGLSAILVTSAAAYTGVKLAGAGYLVYLGIRRLLQPDGASWRPPSRPRTPMRLFREGMMVNILNPKTALFFFAFLPQFVDPSRGAVASQVLALGTLFVAMGILSDGLWAMLAGTAGDRLRRHPGFPRAQRLLSGTVLIVLGLGAALSGREAR